MSSPASHSFPETMDGVREFLHTLPTQTAKLRFILGLDEVTNAPQLAQSIVVNCIDTEHYEWDSSRLTEIGLNAFVSGAMRQRIKEPGPNGWNLLAQVSFYHFRMKANAHCVNKKFIHGDPEANRFGNTRFVTDAQATEMLTNCFNWPLIDGQPEKGICPAVLIGHAVKNDTGAIGDTIGFEPHRAKTVVAIIDTQRMAKEMGIYNPAGSHNEISLASLADHFQIPYRDPHTAGNDAAYTTIAAIYMALYDRDKPTFDKIVRDIIDQVEV